MKRTLLLSITSALIAVGSIGLSPSVQAGGIVTTTGFGTAPGVPANPFGGSGIPSNTTEWTQLSGIPGATVRDPLDTVSLVESITQYKSNPAPGNDGAGTYFVAPGLGVVGNRSPWNFNFNVTSAQSKLSAYSFTLTELNVGNGMSLSFDPTTPLLADNPSGPMSNGNSESLDFPGFGNPLDYNPNLNDTYKFTLDVELNGTVIGQDVVTTVVGTGVPDNTSTASLLGVGLLGLVGFRRKLTMFS